MHLTLPNLLTWLRILLIPLLVGVFYLPDGTLPIQQVNRFAAILFMLAALTDWLDGWLARRLNQISAFGAFLDPVADKLMVAAALIVLVDIDRIHPVIALIIIGREIAISALREWMAHSGNSKNVAVAFVGKIKTAAQMVAVSLLLYDAPLGGLDTHLLGVWLIYLAAVLTLWSMFHYLKQAWVAMR